ncbi:MAG: hypothetical protein ACREBG_03090 [Pyrinomonadaceae bacterium]
MTVIANAMGIEACRNRLCNSPTDGNVTARATPRVPRRLDPLEMLGVIELGVEAAQTRKVFQRRSGRVKLCDIVTDRANGIDRSAAGLRELHQMTTGAVAVNRKTRLERAAWPVA